MQDPAANPPASPEEQIKLLSDQLLHAQRMSALGELASTTTHEFNNVLMTIINYAKMGLRHRDDATRDKAFDKILAAAKRAERITNGVLGLARNRSHERAPTSLAQLVEESLVLLEREMQKYRVRVETQFDPVPEVLACGNQIQQVLLNLMTNARQAMPDGGNLSIKVSSNPERGTVDLSIRDSGKGIPREQLPKIFDRFYTTKSGPDASGKGGTGVGLSLCREIIESHQGRIRVESAVGKGTLFTLMLPAIRGAVTTPTVGVSNLGIPLGTPTPEA